MDSLEQYMDGVVEVLEKEAVLFGACGAIGMK